MRWKQSLAQCLWTQALNLPGIFFAACCSNSLLKAAESAWRIPIASPRCRNFCRGAGVLRQSIVWRERKGPITKNSFTLKCGRSVNVWPAAKEARKKREQKAARAALERLEHVVTRD